jgi:putative sporulation protein YtaF
MALGIDAFMSSFGYGVSNIKIPFKSITIINFICSCLLSIGLFFGSAVGVFVPEKATGWIAFFMLFSLGIYKLFDSAAKNTIRKRNGIDTEVEFSLFSLKFILKIYADPEEADIDNSMDISPKEAAALAIALGLDGLSVGFGVGIAASPGYCALVITLSLISDMLAIILGSYLGNKVAKRLAIDISWLSGAVLMAIAILGAPNAH